MALCRIASVKRRALSPAYRCHSNGIHGGLCSVHRLQKQKREAKKAGREGTNLRLTN